MYTSHWKHKIYTTHFAAPNKTAQKNFKNWVDFTFLILFEICIGTNCRHFNCKWSPICFVLSDQEQDTEIWNLFQQISNKPILVPLCNFGIDSQHR